MNWPWNIYWKYSKSGARKIKLLEKEVLRQNDILGSTNISFSSFFPTPVLWPFIYHEVCDLLQECMISDSTKANRLFLLTWQCRLAVSWAALGVWRWFFPFAQHGPKVRQSQQPSLCWVARFSPIPFTVFRCWFITAFLHWCNNLYFGHYSDHTLSLKMFNVTRDKTKSY